MKYLIIPLVFILSITLFGYRIEIRKENVYFEWGLLPYLKRKKVNK